MTSRQCWRPDRNAGHCRRMRWSINVAEFGIKSLSPVCPLSFLDHLFVLACRLQFCRCKKWNSYDYFASFFGISWRRIWLPIEIVRGEDFINWFFMTQFINSLISVSITFISKLLAYSLNSEEPRKLAITFFGKISLPDCAKTNIPIVIPFGSRRPDLLKVQMRLCRTQSCVRGQLCEGSNFFTLLALSQI